jgi:RNA polymerase sigma-70 factor (sigma-E family)
MDLDLRREEARADLPVTALYQAHALGLIRLAHVMLGDRSAAEDVVQEAFCGLYRRWDQLSDSDKALQYVRSAVLNGSRSVLRQRSTRARQHLYAPPAASAASAESAVLTGEERRDVMHALRQLPDRQREVLVLRFYLDLSEAEIARDLKISPGKCPARVDRLQAAPPGCRSTTSAPGGWRAWWTLARLDWANSTRCNGRAGRDRY